jgi:hypothetical protein
MWKISLKRYALISIVAIVPACPNTEQPETDTTAANTTGATSTDPSTGTDASPTTTTSPSTTLDDTTTDVGPTGTDTNLTITTNTDTTATSTTDAETTATATSGPDTGDTGATDTGTGTDTMDPTAADPVCGAVPDPGDTFEIDFGGEIGVQTFEQAGSTGCHDMTDADKMLISLVWTSTTKGGFSISAALFGGDYGSIGELVGNTLIFAPGNQLASSINSPGLGSYDAKGASFGLHITSLTDDGITGCLVDFDAFYRKGDNLELKPASPIPFACAK